MNQINDFAKIQFHFTRRTPAVRENVFLLHTGAEREPSNARLSEVSEYDFTLQTDGQNYNIDVFFNRLLNDERKVSEANLPRVYINSYKCFLIKT